jgi:hypothetical protein
LGLSGDPFETLKAFANSSPGLRIGNPGTATRENGILLLWCVYPGFQGKPWAGIGERFQRYGLRNINADNDDLRVETARGWNW